MGRKALLLDKIDILRNRNLLSCLQFVFIYSTGFMDLLVGVIYFSRFKEHVLKLLVLLHVSVSLLEPVIFRSVAFLTIQCF